MGGPVIAWTQPLRLADLAHGPVRVALRPNEAERAAIASSLGLEGLPRLSADLEVRPWLDGAAIAGTFQAETTRICGVSLDPFDQALEGDIDVRLAPRGSPNAPADDPGELALDLDAPDPPDLLDGDVVDLAAYLIEHLALSLDPYPRKPGVEFDYVAETPNDSPFAALRGLRRDEN
jgi:hypothetical protein